jgi:hypothetical protein
MDGIMTRLLLGDSQCKKLGVVLGIRARENLHCRRNCISQLLVPVEDVCHDYCAIQPLSLVLN